MFLPDIKFRVGDTAYTIKDGHIHKFDVCRITIQINRNDASILYHGGTETLPEEKGFNEKVCFDSKEEAMYELKLSM